MCKVRRIDTNLFQLIAISQLLIIAPILLHPQIESISLAPRRQHTTRHSLPDKSIPFSLNGLVDPEGMAILPPNMRRFVYFSVGLSPSPLMLEKVSPKRYTKCGLSSVSTSDHCGFSIEFKPLENIGSGIIIWTPELVLRPLLVCLQGWVSWSPYVVSMMPPPTTPWFIFTKIAVPTPTPH